MDSGAKMSVIRQDQVNDFFRPGGSYFPGLVTVGGVPMIVMGEIPLTVRRGGRVIDLPTVQAVNSLIVPNILGIDWVDKAGAFVYSRDGVGMVDYFILRMVLFLQKVCPII